MTNKQKLFGAVLVIVGLAVGFWTAGLVGEKKGVDVGGVYSQSEQTFGKGIAVGSARQFVVSSTGAISSSATVSTGALTATSLTVTTSNTATSTAVVGCVQTYATSTATAVKQVFVTTGATSTFNGTVFWKYGTCP